MRTVVEPGYRKRPLRMRLKRLLYRLDHIVTAVFAREDDVVAQHIRGPGPLHSAVPISIAVSPCGAPRRRRQTDPLLPIGFLGLRWLISE
jgi:hypothetical protein